MSTRGKHAATRIRPSGEGVNQFSPPICQVAVLWRIFFVMLPTPCSLYLGPEKLPSHQVFQLYQQHTGTAMLWSVTILSAMAPKHLNDLPSGEKKAKKARKKAYLARQEQNIIVRDRMSYASIGFQDCQYSMKKSSACRIKRRKKTLRYFSFEHRWFSKSNHVTTMMTVGRPLCVEHRWVARVPAQRSLPNGTAHKPFFYHVYTKIVCLS